MECDNQTANLPQVKAVEKIADLYGDPNADLINVRSISTNPKKLVWTNTSLSDPRHTQGCPKEELEALADVRTREKGMAEMEGKGRKND